MLLLLLVIFGILFEVVILIGGVYLVLKLTKSKPQSITPEKIQVNVSGKIITSEVVRDGVKSALQEIENEKEFEKSLRDKMKTSERVYSSSESDVVVRNSGGDLIPFNLSNEEKEVLNMFYND
jgi:succinyl-CoA synthetase beta subunit